MTLSTLWIGSTTLVSNTTVARSSVSQEISALLQTYGKVSAVQSGYFVPTQTGNHAFKINTGNGCFLAVNGTALLNLNNFSGWANSANISLIAGQSYSFVLSVPIGAQRGITSIVYSFAGGADQAIQNNQIYSATDINSNPIHNSNAILQSLISSGTPAYLLPVANIMPTNITANNRIATVPCPAVIPSTSTGVRQSMENNFHFPCPVQTPVTCYRDIVVTPPIVDPPPPVPVINNTTPGSSGAGNARYRSQLRGGPVIRRN
jgi:hypothetical protein